MIAIRPARDSDRPVIAAIHTTSWQRNYRGVLPDPFLDHELAAYMERRWRDQAVGPRDALLVAAEADAVVGFVAVWAQGEAAFIDNLHVMASRQGQGIGRALLGAAADCMIGHGMRQAYLHVLSANRDARRLYEALGGVTGPAFADVLAGNDVPAHRVDWPDLGTLLRAAQA